MALTRDERAGFNGFFPLDGTEYFEPPQPLVEGVIPKGEFTLLTGAPKVGKSTFAAHLSYSLATGEPFFGKEVREHGTVLYIAMERAYQTQARVNKLFELREQRHRNIILFKPQESDLKTLFFNDDAGDVDGLIERIDRLDTCDLKLVVVDSLENTLAGSDSDSKDAGPWCNGLQRLLDHFETTALVLHHETKASEGNANSGVAYRGSSVFLARSGQWLRAISKNSGRGALLKAQRGNFGSDWNMSVEFNAFGLYEQSMPHLGKDKKPTLPEFVQARLAENPLVTNTRLTDIVRRHPDTQWPNVKAAEISGAIKKLGDGVAKHPNPADGRSKLLKWVG